jgi:aspartyl-tRNA(Asn)/glutamyl-tRNA(Gln) amidotransferase subunit C
VVTEHDVRHIAALARLGLSDERIPAVVRELNGILAHMDALQRADTAGTPAIAGVGAQGMPLRTDGGDQYPLAVPREDFAPAMRDGFFLVPRLATHEALGETETDGA